MKKIQQNILGVIILIAVCVEILAWKNFLTGGDPFLYSNYVSLTYILLYGFGAIIAYMGAKHSGINNHIGSGLLWLGLSLTSYSAALMIWAYDSQILGIETVYPSKADFFYLLYIPLIMYSAYQFAKIYSFTITRKIITESVGILILTGIFLVWFIGLPDFSDNEVGFYVNLFDLLYVIGDWLLAILVFTMLRVTGGKFHKGVVFLVIAAGVQVIGDLVFTMEIANDTFWEGGTSDVLYLISGIFFILTAISTIAIIKQKDKEVIE